MKNFDTIVKNRIEKLNSLKENGFSYPNEFKINSQSIDVEIAILKDENHIFKIGGRIKSKRRMGKLMFCDLYDESGKIQIQFKKDLIGEEEYDKAKKIDIGDILYVEGKRIKTNSGETTIQVSKFVLATKSIHPLPDKHSGIENIELRYRQRYVDLISNKETREVFIKRTKIINRIRDYLNRFGFMEVETPILHNLVSGANAKPFCTYHNALDEELFCRIAPELYLKRLIIGGFERVYEIGRNFRNEGLSTKHNPEFTMLELYWAWSSPDDLMEFINRMINLNVYHLNHNSLIMKYGEHEIDFGEKWKRIPVLDGIKEKLPNIDLNDKNSLIKEAENVQIKLNPNQKLGKIQMDLFEELYEKELINPTFVIDFPIDVSPLARQKDDNPNLANRFELYIGGMEIANGFAELNDPFEQEVRFKEQIKEKNDESMDYDEDYINALKIGMPPTSGCGIGIDRLCMILTNSQSIRDVIFFPQMKTI